ncbi:unnamed protein product [Amoebophrya sp. A25]|nr:unnamed protein product [Amoebophrya sp. A25]|eukprot:GSA25T00014679001.1
MQVGQHQGQHDQGSKNDVDRKGRSRTSAGSKGSTKSKNRTSKGKRMKPLSRDERIKSVLGASSSSRLAIGKSSLFQCEPALVEALRLRYKALHLRKDKDVTRDNKDNDKQVGTGSTTRDKMDKLKQVGSTTRDNDNNKQVGSTSTRDKTGVVRDIVDARDKDVREKDQEVISGSVKAINRTTRSEDLNISRGSRRDRDKDVRGTIVDKSVRRDQDMDVISRSRNKEKDVSVRTRDKAPAPPTSRDKDALRDKQNETRDKYVTRDGHDVRSTNCERSKRRRPAEADLLSTSSEGSKNRNRPSNRQPSRKVNAEGAKTAVANAKQCRRKREDSEDAKTNTNTSKNYKSSTTSRTTTRRNDEDQKREEERAARAPSPGGRASDRRAASPSGARVREDGEASSSSSEGDSDESSSSSSSSGSSSSSSSNEEDSSSERPQGSNGRVSSSVAPKRYIRQGSPRGSPKGSPKGSPRGSPRQAIAARVNAASSTNNSRRGGGQQGGTGQPYLLDLSQCQQVYVPQQQPQYFVDPTTGSLVAATTQNQQQGYNIQVVSSPQTAATYAGGTGTGVVAGAASPTTFIGPDAKNPWTARCIARFGRYALAHQCVVEKKFMLAFLQRPDFHEAFLRHLEATNPEERLPASARGSSNLSNFYHAVWMEFTSRPF